jgi:hypothetical protein
VIFISQQCHYHTLRLTNSPVCRLVRRKSLQYAPPHTLMPCLIIVLLHTRRPPEIGQAIAVANVGKMFELTDSTGNKLFDTISITLVCGALPDRQSHGCTHRTNHSAPRADDCMKTDNPEKCTHKMAEMPRWLSSKKMDVVRSLLADDPAMLCAPRPPTPWP